MPLVINALRGGHTHTHTNTWTKTNSRNHVHAPGLKTGNTSTGIPLSKLKICSRCLMRILKVKYTEFALQQFCMPNGLPACCKTQFHYG